MDTKDIIKKIAKVHEATTDEISAVIKNSENDGFLFECADKVRSCLLYTSPSPRDCS